MRRTTPLTTPLTFAVLAAAVLAAEAAVARDDEEEKALDLMPARVALEKAREQEKPAVILVCAPTFGFAQEALDGPLADPAIIRKHDKVVFGKDDPSRSTEARRLLAEDIEYALVVTDLEGMPIETFTSVPGGNKLLDAIKKATNVTKKKAKVLKGVEKLYERAEKAKKAKDYRTATLGFLQIAALEGQILDERVKKSQRKLNVLNTLAEDKLSDVDGLIAKDKFGDAQKKLAEIKAQFPTPEVDEGVKSRHEKIALEIQRLQNQQNR